MIETVSNRNMLSREPSDSDCLDAIADVAGQLGVERWADIVQGKEQVAILLTRELRRKLMRLLESDGEHVSCRDIVFTDLELEVLRWAALGKSASVTAQILNLKERTVRQAWASLGEKFNCYNITQCVVAATRLGLV